MGYQFFNDKKLDKQLIDNIFTNIVHAFLRTISDHIDSKKIKYDNKEKQTTLIQMVQHIGLCPNIIIGNREEFWDEEDKDALNNFTKGMERIAYPHGYNNYFILDKELIEFSFKNIHVKCEKMHIKDFEDRLERNEKGELLFDITNGL